MTFDPQIIDHRSPIMAGQQLSADYKSPSATESFVLELPKMPTEASNVKDKVEYLSALRSGIVKLQADVNVFLTQKMEEAKGADATGSAKKPVDEQDEEMYGEENPEDDA